MPHGFCSFNYPICPKFMLTQINSYSLISAFCKVIFVPNFFFTLKLIAYEYRKEESVGSDYQRYSGHPLSSRNDVGS